MGPVRDERCSSDGHCASSPDHPMPGDEAAAAPPGRNADARAAANAAASAASTSVLSNDKYRDAVKLLADEGRTRDAGNLRAWLKKHLLTFTFVRGEFLPNPDFRLQKKQ